MNSIYTKRSNAVTQAFNDVAADKILIVPLDFAKAKHVVRMCNGLGEYLHNKSFPVNNDKAGLEYLSQRIQSCCARQGIDKQNVFISAESPHSYCGCVNKSFHSTYNISY